MEHPIKMDDLGGKPPIFGNTYIVYIDSYFPKGFGASPVNANRLMDKSKREQIAEVIGVNVCLLLLTVQKSQTTTWDV